MGKNNKEFDYLTGNTKLLLVKEEKDLGMFITGSASLFYSK